MPVRQPRSTGARARRRPTPEPPGAVPGPLAKRRAQAKANEQAALAAAGRSAALSPGEVEEVFARFQAREPDPRGELVAVNPYTLLVAVVLSAQSTDAGVNRATGPLFAVADTPARMVALGEDRVREFIKTIGFFNAKARNVVELSRLIVERHGGEVPRSVEALTALPGVGRKTAFVVLNVAFGLPTIAVDTHIFRVCNRTGLAPGRDVDAVMDALPGIVPEPYWLHAHHWLILHGRYTCRALKPDCPDCLIADLCLFEHKRAPSPRPAGRAGD